MKNMRLLLPIFLSVLIISSGLSAQKIEDSTFSKNKVYLYASKGNVIVVGKVIELSIVDLQLMNFNDDRFIRFDPKSDNLFIVRYESDIKAAKYDYDYIDNEIYPNKQMNLHFYLPEHKDITRNEIYYLTYNSASDTLVLAPTSDKEVELYVSRFEKREARKWFKKLAKFTLFVIASVAGLRLL
ncbi:MAG: hypothetical protein IIC40_04620 [Candidatus Marinimicrobia bacterium]|nr:hypothetical protein [Candidatus Neomarinimicrobiota bacterium]